MFRLQLSHGQGDTYIYMRIHIYIREYVCRYTIMYGSSTHASLGTQVTLGTDMLHSYVIHYYWPCTWT